MKKTIKILVTLLLFVVAVPLLAGWATSELWNNILTAACGFSAISLWQAVGLFILGQILSGGLFMGIFLATGFIHHAAGHHGGRMRQRWHHMSDEERKAFIEQRAKFGFPHNPHATDNAAQ